MFIKRVDTRHWQDCASQPTEYWHGLQMNTRVAFKRCGEENNVSVHACFIPRVYLLPRVYTTTRVHSTQLVNVVPADT